MSAAPTPAPHITLTEAEANVIADALLSGCMFTTVGAQQVARSSLGYASAMNTHNSLRDAMLLLEGRIAQTITSSQ